MWEQDTKPVYKHCPNCGAKMDKERKIFMKKKKILTDGQTIKAVNCCLRLVSDCENCPYCNEADENFDCERNLRQEVMRIIREKAFLQIENQKLNEINEKLKNIVLKEVIINKI